MSELEQLTKLFERTHDALDRQASRAVNSSLVVRNWLFGWYLVEFENADAARKDLYGEKLLVNLATLLKKQDLKGLSVTNLKLCRIFYLRYQKIGQTPSGQSLRDFNLPMSAPPNTNFTSPPKPNSPRRSKASMSGKLIMNKGKLRMIFNQPWTRPTLEDESFEISQTVFAKFTPDQAVACRLTAMPLRIKFMTTASLEGGVWGGDTPIFERSMADPPIINSPASPVLSGVALAKTEGLSSAAVVRTTTQSNQATAQAVARSFSKRSVFTREIQPVAWRIPVRRPARRLVRHSPTGAGGSPTGDGGSPTREGESHRLSITSPALTPQTKESLTIASPPNFPLLRHLRTSALRLRSGFKTSSVESQTYVSIFNHELPAAGGQRGFAWN